MPNEKNEEAQRILDSAKRPDFLQYNFQTLEYGFGSARGSQAKEADLTPEAPPKTEPKSE